MMDDEAQGGLYEKAAALFVGRGEVEIKLNVFDVCISLWCTVTKYNEQEHEFTALIGDTAIALTFYSANIVEVMVGKTNIIRLA